MQNLLRGMRVIDITTIVMGPMASQMLGDMGAEIIKIEAPGGDLARHSGTPGPQGMGAVFANNNRNKASVCLDLKSEAGRDAMGRLIETADVFLHNMRPEAAARLGLDAASVQARRPDIVYCAAVGFGSDGPYAGKGAYDDVIQAAGGLAALPAELGGRPAYVPSIMADKISGMHVLTAILAATTRRAATGEGCAIEVPMFESVAAFVMNEHLDGASYDMEAKPGYVRMLSPARRPFATSDGYLGVMPYSEAHWRRAMNVTGNATVCDEPWFTQPAQRNKRSGDLYSLVEQALPAKSTADWIEILTEADIPHSPVASLTDLLKDPHLTAQGFFEPRDDLEGRVRSVPMPLRFDGVETGPDTAAPALGADTRRVLAELGYEEADLTGRFGLAPD